MVIFILLYMVWKLYRDWMEKSLIPLFCSGCSFDSIYSTNFVMTYIDECIHSQNKFTGGACPLPVSFKVIVNTQDRESGTSIVSPYPTNVEFCNEEGQLPAEDTPVYLTINGANLPITDFMTMQPATTKSAIFGS